MIAFSKREAKGSLDPAVAR